MSRILNDDEVVVVAANAALNGAVSVSVIVDATLHAAGDGFRVLYSKTNRQATRRVVERLAGVRVDEVDGSTSFGPLHAIRVDVQPGEVQVLGR